MGRNKRVEKGRTPHVVMTGSLKTLQHSWQQSFTEGCSANTWGSCSQTQTHVLLWQPCFYVFYTVSVRTTTNTSVEHLCSDIPCLLLLRAERKWSAATCWTRSGASGLRWLNQTFEECRWEAEFREKISLTSTAALQSRSFRSI